MYIRKYECGSAKRKKADEKISKHEQLLQQTARIDAFMSSLSSEPANEDLLFSSASISSAIAVQEGIVGENQPTPFILDTLDESEPLPNDASSFTLTELVNEETSTTTSLIPLPYETDVGLWKNVSKDHYIKKGSVDCQYINSDFVHSKRSYLDKSRFCTPSIFTRVHSLTSERSKRTWLCYSPATGKIYCFLCKLFSTSQNDFMHGFNDWKNGKRSIDFHEKSQVHLTASVAFTQRSSLIGCVNVVQEEQIRSTSKYWQSVLLRAVSVIKFLAERGLSFRGHDEKFGTPTNGNYMGILDLLAMYDPFLTTHIEKYGNPGRGQISYLSSTICEELICLMGKRVLSIIVDELFASKYYCICIDSTPDISHVDQLTIVVRYVKEDGPVERFLSFIAIESHTGKGLAAILLSFLEETGIAITNCRGQSYDNASNMSGRYNGVQAHIQSLNKLAMYIPCFAHSLNLVGKSAVDCCLAAVKYFCIVEKIYTFFSVSTHRWAILFNAIERKIPLPKRLSDTRWSCHADAIKALKMGFNSICSALEQIKSDQKEKQVTRQEALGIVSEFYMLEFGILTELWHSILQRFNKTSLALQSSSMDLNVAVVC